MALARRLLEVTISRDKPPTKPQPVFSGTNSNTVTLSGLRMSARVSKAGGASDSTLDLTIYGMTRSLMDDLSTLGIQINLVQHNQIVLTAGDEASGLSTVFVGYTLACYADFRSAPDVSFHITAHTTAPNAVIPVPVSSYDGPTDVATILSSLASRMGLKFENNGVSVKMASPYLSGDAKTQARAVVEDAGISWNGGDAGVLAIWPKNGSRGGQAPLISPGTGMIGYPTYTAYGIIVRSIFNPNVGFGGKINVLSDLQPACGTWNVYGLEYELDSQVNGGSWFMTILASNPSFPTPAVQVQAP